MANLKTPRRSCRSVETTSITGTSKTQTDAVAAHMGLVAPSPGSGANQDPPSNKVRGARSFATSV